MKKEKTLKAIYGSDEKPLKINDIDIPCYVLENGQRVLSQSGMFKALGMSKGGSGDGGDRLANFVRQDRLNPFIGKDLTAMIESPIKFQVKKGTIANGYDAETLQSIVRAVSKAYLLGKLQKQQEHIGKNAEKLDDAFSKIGLIALIDEVTGYQYEREAHELQTILKAYISEELLSWQQRFPHEFYKEIFRLRGWEYTAANIKTKPSVVGHWTNRLVYDKLPKGILQELKKQTPKADNGNRKHHYHRLLTEDVGHPHLQKQIVSVVTLMSVSDTWRDFIKLYNKKFGQQELEFGEVEDVKPILDERKLSTFNKDLKKALNYNAKEEK